MQEATEPGCLEELIPQSSGQAVAQEDGDYSSIANWSLKRLLSGDGRYSKLHVNSVESSEPTVLVQ